MLISEVSEKMNMTPDTLRYYEKIGIIPRVDRSANGIRNYSDDDLNWIKLAKCMRQSGLSIHALSKYIELYHQGDDTKDTRRDILHQERAELLKNIEQMQETLALLNKKIAMYDSDVEMSNSDSENTIKAEG
ncbi:MerR family transcriptional regulator [Staphylococcus gallinarum]